VTRVRRIEAGDREAIRELISGNERVQSRSRWTWRWNWSTSPSRRKGQDDYHPYVLVEATARVAAYACFGKNAMTTGTFHLYWIGDADGPDGKRVRPDHPVVRRGGGPAARGVPSW